MTSPRLPEVSSRYGAPLGRRSDNVLASGPNRIRLFRVPINSGGYDSGGAYWGLGAPLWCAIDVDGSTVYFRARNREAAKAYVSGHHADDPDDVRFYR